MCQCVHSCTLITVSCTNVRRVRTLCRMLQTRDQFALVFKQQYKIEIHLLLTFVILDIIYNCMYIFKALGLPYVTKQET